MISNEVYVDILVLRKHGWSLRKIAAAVGCAVNTVRKQVISPGYPRYVRRIPRVSKLDGFKDYLRERQDAACPAWIPATVLYREICEQGYRGGLSQLRAYLRTLKPRLSEEPVIRFETAPGEQMQMDWVEFRKGRDPLYAFCATLGYSRFSHVVFVTDMQVETLIDCHRQIFEAVGGVPRRILYDNMKTVVLGRDVDGPGQHRYHAGFLDYARHCGFSIRLCRPCRAKTKGKIERFNGYLRYSFHVPLVARLKPLNMTLDAATANREVRAWLREVANVRVHVTTEARPVDRLAEEQACLQALPPPWRGDIQGARPIQPGQEPPSCPMTRPLASVPVQHDLAVYDALLTRTEANV